MENKQLVYKSFCWSLGTTSFRTKYFNQKIEIQLDLLSKFWSIPSNKNAIWDNDTQEKYYDFLQENDFLTGDAKRKDKDAREKTSGLVNIGLIDDNRKLTEVGETLLKISHYKDFAPHNQLHIPNDSYIYLKQLLKSSIVVDTDIVRPFIVTLYLLSKLDFLSIDEFTYLLPLCTNPVNTEMIITRIKDLREGKNHINDIIIDIILQKDNYQIALQTLLENKISADLICTIGINRKSRNYDLPYAKLYENLYEIFVLKQGKIEDLLNALSKLKLKKWWFSYLFKTSNIKAILKNPEKQFCENIFQKCHSEHDFKTAFFKIMHLFKVKATLADYADLNIRYFKTADVLLFNDNTIKLDLIPKHFFNGGIETLYKEAFTESKLLMSECPIEEISKSLNFDKENIINKLEQEIDENILSITQVYSIAERKRYERFLNLIETKFTNDNLLLLLNHFNTRNDSEINKLVTENADIPTIFEYILGIIWYKISEKTGKILDFMKLSLDANLLPVSHAVGGEADIVYNYKATDNYPQHTLLLEATLADRTNQRRMEMEPVSRHLGEHLLKNKDHKSYCIFVTNNLNIQVIADFRGRKNLYYYNTNNVDDYIVGMNIIPLETTDIKTILERQITYSQLYKKFEAAYCSEEMRPKEWYEQCINITNDNTQADSTDEHATLEQYYEYIDSAAEDHGSYK